VCGATLGAAEGVACVWGPLSVREVWLCVWRRSGGVGEGEGEGQRAKGKGYTQHARAHPPPRPRPPRRCKPQCPPRAPASCESATTHPPHPRLPEKFTHEPLAPFFFAHHGRSRQPLPAPPPHHAGEVGYVPARRARRQSRRGRVCEGPPENSRTSQKYVARPKRLPAQSTFPSARRCPSGGARTRPSTTCTSAVSRSSSS
jgi:hypothetical protein